jgi:hypothetical protein
LILIFSKTTKKISKLNYFSRVLEVDLRLETFSEEAVDHLATMKNLKTLKMTFENRNTDQASDERALLAVHVAGRIPNLEKFGIYFIGLPMKGYYVEFIDQYDRFYSQSGKKLTIESVV